MERFVYVLVAILFLALLVSIVLVIELWIEKRSLEAENNLLKKQLNETERYMYELWVNYTKLAVENKMQLEHIYYLDKVIENLTSTLNNITITLSEYTSLPLSFKRVLTLDEVLAAKWYVEAAGVIETSPWDSYRNLYIWVSSSIRYTYDPLIPVPYCEFLANSSCILRYNIVDDYVQPPSYTLLYRQGDCEDMAILLYAMIKYYELFIHKSEYIVWIASIVFEDYTGHTAIIIPAVGGKIGVLDPAGRYMTMDIHGLLVAKPVREELENYSKWWEARGGIKTITLYRVDVVSRVYYIDAMGTLEEIIEYIESTY